MKRLFTLATIVVALALAAVAASKNICQVHRLSTNEVGITCTNGADSTGIKVGETLVISCGTDDDDEDEPEGNDRWSNSKL